jgi:hypothetical protein
VEGREREQHDLCSLCCQGRPPQVTTSIDQKHSVKTRRIQSKMSTHKEYICNSEASLLQLYFHLFHSEFYLEIFPNPLVTFASHL